MLEAYIYEKTLRKLEQGLPQDASVVISTLEDDLSVTLRHSRAALLLVRCYLLEGMADKARQTLENLLATEPDNNSAKLELAKLLHGEKDYTEAIRLLTEVTNSSPELDAVWLLLSHCLEQDGQTQASQNAKKQHEMIKAFNGGLVTAHKAFAVGEFAKADSICRQLLQAVPGEVRVLRLLAQIAGRLRHYEIAQNVLESCIEARPDDAALNLEYATALLSAKNFNKALDQCNRVIELAPELVDAYSVKAEVLYNLGQYEAVVEVFRQLAEVHEDRQQFKLNLGKALKTVGQGKEAIACFHEAIDGERVLGQAYWELASLKTYRFSEEEVESMQALLKAGQAAMDQLLIEFALGKALEDSGQYNDSFECYRSANNAYSKIRPYRYLSNNARQIAFFGSDGFPGRAAGHDKTEAPVFVVGLPRSGSTLVEQILTSHSMVDATMELTTITTISRQLNGSSLPGKGEYPESLATLDSSRLEDLARSYLDSAEPFRQGAPHFVDKAPGNFHHIGLIKTLFPNAIIIDVRREPMAVGWSLYRHFFAESFLFSYDLNSIGQYYNDYLELMDHWHRVFPGQILTVNYEDLVQDLPGQVQALLQHCRLPFEQACVDFHRNRRAVATPSSEQVRQPIFTDALTQWKNYESFLAPLKQALNKPGSSQA